ncbi:MAG: DUF1080 domain-containing protein [Chitinophagaceae bacterium]|nr:DUF1080 domain-containing protein [Chitinophagaceae bacterium]
MSRIFFLFSLLIWAGTVTAQLQSIDLTTLDAFRNPGKNWSIVADVYTSYDGKVKTRNVSGTGVVMNYYSPKHESDLITKEEWGDMELEFEFMMFKSSNSGVYLQGRYEVQLYDSWKKLNPAWYDAGAIYSRYNNGYSYEGTQPVMNVAKAPGLWQKLQIRFRAPRFNDKGEKTENARFESVQLNGVTIIREVEVSGCTRACLFPEEKPTGPLVFQGDHGPVAFRNIRYGKLIPPPPPPEKRDIWDRNSHFWKTTVNPLVVIPVAKPEIIRTFLKYGDTTLTHVLSVGSVNELNYSYDVKQGAVFQFWRGKFLDVTAAWWDRGWMQLGVPMGAVITLPNTPVVAVLTNENSAWPGAAAFDDMHNKGYVLDRNGFPTFKYSYNNLEVEDKIDFPGSHDGISRTLTVTGNTAGAFCRIANGKKIEKIKEDLFLVDDKSYYLQVDKKLKPFVRQSGDGYELIVKYNDRPVTYNIIW